MPTITLTFASISELEAFRSQGQTAQSKTNKLFVVEINYIESTYIGGIFSTLSEAYRYYKDVCKTHYNDPNYEILIMEWDLDNQCGVYLRNTDLEVD